MFLLDVIAERQPQTPLPMDEIGICIAVLTVSLLIIFIINAFKNK